MGLMDGKKCLIMGVANQRSIAWGIAQALHREGAQLALVECRKILRTATFHWTSAPPQALMSSVNRGPERGSQP